MQWSYVYHSAQHSAHLQMPPRAVLSVKEKIELIQEHDLCKSEGRAHMQHQLPQWATQQFGLSVSLSQSVVSKILKKRAGILQCGTNPGARWLQPLCISNVSNAVCAWINDFNHKRVNVSDALIRVKVHRIVDLANKSLPPDEQIKYGFSNSWLHRFKIVLVSRAGRATGKVVTQT